METGWERTFFVTAVTWQRRCIFSSEALTRTLLETIYEYRAEKRFLLHAFVIMPDHMHLLITPGEVLSLEEAMQLIKGGSSFRIRKERPNLLIWQKSFTNHRIGDQRDFDQHLEYIHENPVRKGLAHVAEEYRYSSAYPGFGPPPSGGGLPRRCRNLSCCQIEPAPEGGGIPRELGVKHNAKRLFLIA